MTDTAPPETSLFARVVEQFNQFLSRTPDVRQFDDEGLPVTETLEILVQARRRAVLRELVAADRTPVSASTLAEWVACSEYGCEVEALSSDQRKRVYIALIQCHLPKLAQANVITYDSENRLVDHGPEFDCVWQAYSAVFKSLS